MPTARERTVRERDAARAAEVVAAVMWSAHRAADLTARFLTRAAAELGVPAPTAVPPGFALALGAALQVAAWDAAGLRPYLPEDLPRAADLIADLFRRLRASPESLGPAEAGLPLVERVLGVRAERLALHAPAELGVDVAVDGGPDDALLEGLADFLWDNRHLWDDRHHIHGEDS